FLENGKDYQKTFETMIDTAKKGEIWRGELTIIRKDCSSYKSYSIMVPIKNESNYIINHLFINRDITHELEIVRNNERMEALRTLAGGIAHDLNNILFPILGYADMTLDDVQEGSIAKSNLKEIIKAANRAKELIDMILNFTRKTEQGKQSMQVQPIIKEALKLLRASLPSNIEIKQYIENPLPAILGDPVQIHQLFIALCSYIYQKKIDNYGLLDVKLIDFNITINDSYIKNGKYIKLTIQNRSSIDLNNIKEDFVSIDTELSVVKEIVTNHGGQISTILENNESIGFSVYLPQIHTEKISMETFSVDTAPKGNEHILIVDDEMPIVILLTQLFESLGYRVTPRSDGISALETFKVDPKSFDIVITDQTMPKLTGDELAKKLLEITPDIPIILFTGFTDAINKEQAKAIGISEYVTKPISMTEFAELIRKVLDFNKL
ncbi:MAG: response regulator, partial [Desulfobacterales bacterium]|nr:response regulator [Desulfobacterales bacterium]